MFSDRCSRVSMRISDGNIVKSSGCLMYIDMSSIEIVVVMLKVISRFKNVVGNGIMRSRMMFMMLMGSVSWLV